MFWSIFLQNFFSLSIFHACYTSYLILHNLGCWTVSNATPISNLFVFMLIICDKWSLTLMRNTHKLSANIKESWSCPSGRDVAMGGANVWNGIEWVHNEQRGNGWEAGRSKATPGTIRTSSVLRLRLNSFLSPFIASLNFKPNWYSTTLPCLVLILPKYFYYYSFLFTCIRFNLLNFLSQDKSIKFADLKSDHV